MGYTHYWNLTKKPSNFKEGMMNVQLDIQQILRVKPNDIVLRGGDGSGSPDFTNEFICFNGDGSKGLDHETFYFDGVTDFTFCKTNHKPYDLIVCLILISLKNHIEGFDFSTDGDKTEWEPIFEFYETNIGKVSQEIKDKIYGVLENN